MDTNIEISITDDKKERADSFEAIAKIHYYWSSYPNNYGYADDFCMTTWGQTEAEARERLVKELSNYHIAFAKASSKVQVDNKPMKTIQQQLADRIYELLPEKKELEFGCQVKFGFSSARYCGEDNDWVYLEVLEPVRPIKEIQKVGKTLALKIIGQPIRLADLLLAISEEYGWIYSRDVRKIFYNYDIARDNILEQSDEFCKFALEILNK